MPFTTFSIIYARECKELTIVILSNSLMSLTLPVMVIVSSLFWSTGCQSNDAKGSPEGATKSIYLFIKNEQLIGNYRKQNEKMQQQILW